MNIRIKYSPVCSRDKLDKSEMNRFVGNNYPYIILVLSVLAVIALYLGGILTYLFEEDFTKFKYPVEVHDIRGLVDKIDNYEMTDSIINLSNRSTDNPATRKLDYNSILEALNYIHKRGEESWKVDPLTNFKDFHFAIDINPSCQERSRFNDESVVSNLSNNKSLERISDTSTNSSPLNEISPNDSKSITVIIIVKSAVNNYARRDALRKSWYLNRTVDVFNFKTVFMVGMCHQHNPVPRSTLELKDSWSPMDCEENIQAEARKFGDIVQSSGIDSYYNNTIKTFMTLRWLNERCPSDFSIAIDDDYVFELENFMKFMFEYSRDYSPYLPNRESNKTLEDGVPTTSVLPISSISDRRLKITALKHLSKQYLYAGYLMNYVHPLRSRLSKWYISRVEYPYDRYPPFITGGFIVMSYKTVRHLYYASYFTQPFKFDDVYIGILAYRLGIRSTHSDNFMCLLDEYMDQKPIRPNSTKCVAVHDIEPASLIEFWNDRKSAGASLAIDAA